MQSIQKALSAVSTRMIPVSLAVSAGAEIGYANQQIQLASTLFERSRDAIVVIDAQHLIVETNAAYLQLMGYSPDALLGRPIRLVASNATHDGFFKELAASVSTQGHWQGEVSIRHHDGCRIPVWLTLTEVRDLHGAATNYVAVFTDISKQRETQDQLHRLAYTDALTGLPNRTCFYQHARRVLEEREYLGYRPVILMIDLDEFKQVNDSQGHAIGDMLLRQVADRMKTCLRRDDMLARFGGDEFTVLLEDVGQDSRADLIASKLLESLLQPFNLQGIETCIRASIGIYHSHAGDDTIETLLQKADIAMYQAKAQGKGCFRYYDDSLNTQVRRKAILTSALFHAIEKQQLHVCYQVQVNSLSGNPVGMEALLRWTHPDLGVISPYEFIPLAEACGLILPLGEWVFEEVCRQQALWLAQGMSALPVAVNVSADQFYDERLAERLTALIQAVRIPADLIEVEVTESAAMNNPEKTVAQLEALRAAGVSITIDDFGTGYSSLSHLKKLPVSKLKVDRSFVSNMDTDADDRAITRAVIQLAHTMKLQVVAEGVETEAVRQLLVEQGCDLIQGYLFSRPTLPERIPSVIDNLNRQAAWPVKQPVNAQPKWCSFPCKKRAKATLAF